MVFAVNHQRVLHAQLVQDFGHRFYQVAVVNAQEEEVRVRRVRERPQDIEDRAEAQLFADGSHIFHSRVIFLGEEEAESYLVQKFKSLRRILGDVHAQGFLHVRGAGLGRSGAVAMLGHLHAGGSDDKGRGGGNIEAIRPVAAGTNDFQDLHARMRHRCRVFSHGRSAAGNLIDGFRPGALGRERCKERCVLGGCGLAVHDFIHHFVGFFEGEISLSHDFLDSFFNHFSFLHFFFREANKKSVPDKYLSRTDTISAVPPCFRA